jgi:hypothetical protein
MKTDLQTPLERFHKAWLVPIGTILGIGTALFLGLRYVINSEVADLRNDISTIQKTLDTLHSDNKATDSRIDNLLVDAFKQAFAAAKATKPTAGDIHRTTEIISIAGKTGVKLDPTILSEYGHWVSTLSKQPSLSNVAFHSLNETVSYRSFLNADVAPKFSDARKLLQSST